LPAKAVSLTDPLALTLILASLIAAGVSAAFAFGGGLLLLSVNAAVLPAEALVPMQAALMIGALTSRTGLFWRDLAWDIVGPFSFGCVFGTLIGARIYVDLPERWISTGIATVLLVATWMPRRDWRIKLPQPYFVLGVLHSLISTLFAVGALLQPVVARSSLTRQQLAATIAGSMLAMQLIKVAGFATWGFDFRPWLPLIAACWLAAIPGTWFGHHLLNRMSERLFRNAFKVLTTAIALRLLYRAWFTG
jgi:uncharacterized membrane protein YfcA